MANLKLFRNNYQPSVFGSIFEDLFDNDIFSEIRPYRNGSNMIWDSDKEEYSIIIEAPGFTKDEIKLESNSKGLLITGEIQREEIKNRIGEKSIHYSYSNSDLDTSSVKAELKDGLLYISAKKAKDKASKFIEIN